MISAGLLPFAGPIDAARPLAPGDPLNADLLAAWQVLPGRDSGPVWYDAAADRPATVPAPTATSGFRPTTRPGGRGHLLFGALAAHAVPFPAVDLGTAHAVCYWIRPTLVGAGQVVIGGPASPQTYAAFLDSSGQAYYQAAGSFCSWTAAVTFGAWQHLAFVRSGTALELFRDGISRGTRTLSAGNNALVLSTLGAFAGGTFPYSGELDDVRFYSRPLGRDSIRALYEAGPAGYPGVHRRIAASPAAIFFVPAPAQELSPPAIGPLEALYAPTLSPGPVALDLPAIGPDATPYAPTLAPGPVALALPAIGPGTLAFPPALTFAQSLLLPALAAGAEVYPPSLSVAGVRRGPARFASTSIPLGPDPSRSTSMEC